MEEETTHSLGDVNTAPDAAAVHQKPQAHASEPHTDETTQADDAVDTSLVSEHYSDEEDLSETMDAEESTDTGFRDNSALSVDEDPESPHNATYAEDSLVEEDEFDDDPPEPRIDDTSSILPSIESDAEHDTQDLSALDDSLLEDDRSSHKSPSRRTSGRTEALIQKAARDIVARIEGHHTEEQEPQGDESILSSYTEDQYEQSNLSVMDNEEAVQPEQNEQIQTADEGGDSSSQHGTEEDVFSDKSARSSLGSYDGGSESGKNTTIGDNISTATRTPRISNISQYDSNGESFVPTARGAPRPPFRSPSDVRAMQMSSPPASVFGSVVGSPRSSKRHFPTVSRLGSPIQSAQYSPKNRTPSRFKAKEAPLVLLHVTLLPLRWVWGDVISSFDAADMTEEAKTLREAWRMLQDRIGDTVCERGILLGHPQNDYELLEERLLEALDLPMRRRARILECGHYLGPANENTLVDDSESDDDEDTFRSPMKRHWCNTCKNEIRCDALGVGKIFRVKVYASNGLMKAAAWDACWKEMERVDIELEPVVEPRVNEELARLSAALQEREAASHQQIQLAAEILQDIEDQVDRQMDQSFDQQPDLLHASLEIAPAAAGLPTGRPSTSFDERRYLDEERLREVYGSTPQLEAPSGEPGVSARQPHPDSYIPPPSPRSPSEEAHEHREARRQSLQSASFFELLAQSVRVLMQDTRNIFIVGLSFMVLLMALRAPQQRQIDTVILENKSMPQMEQAPVIEGTLDVPAGDGALVLETVVSHATMMQGVATQAAAEQDSALQISASSVMEPCSTSSLAQHVPVIAALEQQAVPYAQQDISTQKTTVKVVQTVTEFETLRIETVTETETMKVKATVTMTENFQAIETDMYGLEPMPKGPVAKNEGQPSEAITYDLEPVIKEPTADDGDMVAYGVPTPHAEAMIDESMLIEAN